MQKTQKNATKRNKMAFQHAVCILLVFNNIAISQKFKLNF